MDDKTLILTVMGLSIAAIGAGIAVIWLIIWLFEIKPKQVRGFIAKNWRPALRRLYFGFAFLITAIILVLGTLIATLVDVSFGLVLLLITMLWAILGYWAPSIDRAQNPSLARAFDIVSLGLGAVLLVGFWFFQWPEWQLPLTLTLFVLPFAILAFVQWLRHKLQKRRQLDGPAVNEESPQVE